MELRPGLSLDFVPEPLVGELAVASVLLTGWLHLGRAGLEDSAAERPLPCFAGSLSWLPAAVPGQGEHFAVQEWPCP